MVSPGHPLLVRRKTPLNAIYRRYGKSNSMQLTGS
jgi:hypothetical protein